MRPLTGVVSILLFCLVLAGSATALPRLEAEQLRAASAGVHRVAEAPTGDAEAAPPATLLPPGENFRPPTREEEPAPAEPDCRREACVALTFDDGPSPYTTKILRVLRETGTPATFFMLGQNVKARPGLARRVAADGHQLGNHSWDHPSFSKLGKRAFDRQLRRTDKAIERATGQRPTVIRPPYGAYNAKTRRWSDRPLVLWDVDSRDWAETSRKRLAAAVVRDTRRGSIVLMHDIQRVTPKALPRIIKGLRAEGYTLVTLDRLWAHDPPAAGQAVRRHR